MDDIGLFEIIVILGLVGIAVYFVVVAGKAISKWINGNCVPSVSGMASKAAGAVASAADNTLGFAPESPAAQQSGLTQGTPLVCSQSWLGKMANKVLDWLGVSQLPTPPSQPAPAAPASSTGVTPGAGQPCGCARAVVSCCAGWCCQNYSIGG